MSPIEYGHVLLVPRVLDCLPQRLDTDSLLLALHFAHEADNPYLRVGYNSLGAFATINHLHFQVRRMAHLAWRGCQVDHLDNPRFSKRLATQSPELRRLLLSSFQCGQR